MFSLSFLALIHLLTLFGSLISHPSIASTQCTICNHSCLCLTRCHGGGGQLLCGTEASYPSNSISQPVSVSDNCTCIYSNGFYHERTVGSEEVAPDVAFCFNAGVHGYTSWLQTMLLLRY